MTALGVDHVTLTVHHIVVLNQALTDTEVVLLHFLLRVLDRLADHRVLNHLTLLHAEAVHHGSYTLRTEHSHQVILKRHEEYRTARITLTSGTTAQLTIHTAALVTLCADDSQTAGFFYFRRKLDIRTTTGHVRCYSYYARTTGFGYYHCFLLVELGVQYVVRDLAQ